jgi:hypothetical protein
MATAPTVASRSIPLKDVEITWAGPRGFTEPCEATPVTIAGPELGAVLAWVAKVRPSLLTTTDRRRPLDGDTLATGYTLEGLAHVAKALACTDLGETPAEPGPIFEALGALLEDLAIRVQTAHADDRERIAASATVTVRGRSAAAVAETGGAA